MNINDLAMFKAVITKLHWLDQRQRLLAENIANADTPNYQARDLPALSFSETLRNNQSGTSFGGGLTMAKTSDVHFSGGTANDGAGFVARKQKYESSPSKNGVILEEELIKVTETASNYKLMLRLYKKGADMMKMAVKASR